MANKVIKINRVTEAELLPNGNIQITFSVKDSNWKLSESGKRELIGTGASEKGGKVNVFGVECNASLMRLPQN